MQKLPTVLPSSSPLCWCSAPGKSLNLDSRQSIEQRLAPGDDERGIATQHLRFAARQVELAAADIDPHVVVGRHQIGIARQAEAGNVKQRRQTLVRYLDVDVFEMNRIAEVFSGAVKFMLHGDDPDTSSPPY